MANWSSLTCRAPAKHGCLFKQALNYHLLTFFVIIRLLRRDYRRRLGALARVRLGADQRRLGFDPLLFKIIDQIKPCMSDEIPYVHERSGGATPGLRAGIFQQTGDLLQGVHRAEDLLDVPSHGGGFFVGGMLQRR